MRANPSIRHFAPFFGVGLLMLVVMACGQENIVAPEPGGGDQLLAAGADAAASNWAPRKDEGSQKRAFSALQIVTAGSPPQVSFHGTTRHSRDAMASGILTGDIAGTWTSTGNGVHVQKGDVLSGTVRLTATIIVSELFGEAINGTLEIRGIGHEEISPDGHTHTGRSHGYGTGELAGTQLFATHALVSGAPPTFAIDGHILDAQ